MTPQEFIKHMPCVLGAIVYALLAFYLTFTICCWLFELPLKLWDRWYGP